MADHGHAVELSLEPAMSSPPPDWNSIAIAAQHTSDHRATEHLGRNPQGEDRNKSPRQVRDDRQDRYYRGPDEKCLASEVNDGVALGRDHLSRAKVTGTAIHLTMM